MEPKPKHLGPQYGAQFRDRSIARVYHTRPPYPHEVFDVLSTLLPPDPTRLLDLGCGTGEIVLGMLRKVGQIDAVDPSATMLTFARSRPGAESTHIRWICETAESFGFDGPYALVTAGESLHWMDWETVLPKIAAHLEASGYLALVDGRELHGLPWEQELTQVIPRYSTNQDYRAYNLIEELHDRELFQETARHITQPVEFSQTVEDYIESFHSRNGLSRERMTKPAAEEFDQAVGSLVRHYCPEGMVCGRVTAKVVWGRPAPA